jgi:hypothetical protein
VLASGAVATAAVVGIAAAAAAPAANY